MLDDELESTPPVDFRLSCQRTRRLPRRQRTNRIGILSSVRGWSARSEDKTSARRQQVHRFEWKPINSNKCIAPMMSSSRQLPVAVLLVAVAVVASSMVDVQLAEAAAAETCHLREFDLCMTSAIVFVQQPPGAKVTEAEIEKQCNLFKDTEDCLEDFTERCMTSQQNSLVDFMSGGVLRYMRDYCKKGSDLRKLYLKHGECVNKQRKNSNKCLVEFQAAIEKSTLDTTHWKERPKVLCCALDRLGECNRALLEPACGKEAIEVGNSLIRGTFSRAAVLTCDKYKHTSDECKKLLPPPDTKPKGAKSSSVMSKLISTVTQV